MKEDAGRPHFSRRTGVGRHSVLWSAKATGDRRMWTWMFAIACLASIAVADHMARMRGRSPRIWFWIAILVGPLAPLALLILGQKHPAPAN